MKKVLIPLMTLALVVGFTGVAMAGISGSAHDFSGSTWSGGQICIVCHTPHNADTTVTGAPLWNHAVTTATYTLYTSPTLDATLGQPAGVSKLCLSCHDGTLAVDSFGGTAGSTMVSGSKLIGTDLSNDHPISFAYNSALATTDGGLLDPTTAPSGLQGSSGTISDDLLVGGTQLECSSCHDVHNQYGWGHLLKKSNASSALCLTCHDK